MIFNRQTRMVERYLAGRMMPDEERLFQEMLSRDKGLRELVDEEKAIDMALRHDRDSIPVVESTPSEELLRKLEMDPALLARQQRGGNPSGSPSGRLGRIASRFREGGVSGWLFVADLVVIGATVGILALAPMNDVAMGSEGAGDVAPEVARSVVPAHPSPAAPETNRYLGIVETSAHTLGRGFVAGTAWLQDSIENEKRRRDVAENTRRKRRVMQSPDDGESEMQDFLRRELAKEVGPMTPIHEEDSLKMRMELGNE